MGRTSAAALSLAGLLLLALLSNMVGCDRGEREDRRLTEREFADLFVEVVRLERVFAEQPDSLAHHREALLHSRGITRADIERFLGEREHSPKAWNGVFRHLEHRFTEQVDTLPEAASRTVRYRPPALDSPRAAPSTLDTSAAGGPPKYRVPLSDTAAASD